MIAISKTTNSKAAASKYRAYLRSLRWQELRSEAHFLAGYRCELCGKDISLDVHHLRYLLWGTETPEDLIVLCRECHKLIHARPF